MSLNVVLNFHRESSDHIARVSPLFVLGLAGGEAGTCSLRGLNICYEVRQEHLFDIEAMHNCGRDEGGPLGAGLQEQASNHLKLLW